MDEDKEERLEAPPSTEGVSSQDRERAHLEHARIVEGAAKAHVPDSTDAEVIAQATDRHLEEVVKPSLLPKPNSTDPDAPLGVADDGRQLSLSMFAILAAALVCIAPAVHDGDTIRCGGARVRLWGMDAPEPSGSPRCRYDDGWACDPAAKRWAIPARRRLQQLTQGRVTCDPVDVDRFGRTVARCMSAGVDVGGQLVRAGLARDYTRYSHGRYLREETRARREHRGMWSEAGPR